MSTKSTKPLANLEAVAQVLRKPCCFRQAIGPPEMKAAWWTGRRRRVIDSRKVAGGRCPIVRSRRTLPWRVNVIERAEDVDAFALSGMWFSAESQWGATGKRMQYALRRIGLYKEESDVRDLTREPGMDIPSSMRSPRGTTWTHR